MQNFRTVNRTNFFPSYLILTAVLCFILPAAGAGQYATVSYDYEKNYFGENQALPAGKPLMITGVLPPGVSLVEVCLFRAKGNRDKEPLTTAIWKRPFNKTSDNFVLPLNYLLEGSSSYDLFIGFYRPLDTFEQKALLEQMQYNLDAYLEQVVTVTKKKVKLDRSPPQLMADMEEIVERGLQYYRSPTISDPPGFSDIVRQSLEGLDQADPKSARLAFPQKEGEAQWTAYVQQRIDATRALIHSELRFLLNHPFAVLQDSRYIDNYPTEKEASWFSLNVGYGGVYLGDEIDDLDSFGDGVYLGLGFPLATSARAPRILQDASVNFGFFLNEFENEQGEKITGPIVDRPLYAGLDYKLFQFIRLNFGATLLEKHGEGDNNQLLVRPFVGLSAKVNISLSLDK